MSIFEKVIDALNRTGARYVVVGGVAVTLRGHQRFTSDIDVVIDLEPSSAELLVGSLEQIGFRSRVGVTAKELADAKTRESWISEKGAKVISYLHPEHPTFAVDVFIDPPLSVDDLFTDSSLIPIGRISARVASIPHLIEMKERAGRPDDLSDVTALRAILQKS